MNLLKDLMDIIYPPRCPVCQAFLTTDSLDKEGPGGSFCPACLADFQPITSPRCPVCTIPFFSESESEKDHLCEECLRKRPLYEAAGAPYLYAGAIMGAIHQFKYGTKSYLANSLGPLLAQYALSWVKQSGNLVTIPVPLHTKRLRERGFNQSLLLARHVAGQLHTELDFLSLRRIRYTAPQTGLKKTERQKNVRKAFKILNHEAVKRKTALLVDDVLTTGNTLNECARVLRKAGCEKVLCLVLARAGSF